MTEDNGAPQADGLSSLRDEAADASSPKASIPSAAEARDICQRFALQHKVIFDDEGSCGFGRPCVGFREDNWIAHNPDKMVPSTYGHSYEQIPELASRDCYPPDGVEAYHKHDCLAVLGHGDEAIQQLAQWVLHMEGKGQVGIVQYATGATGIQAMLSGVFARAVMVYPAAQGIEAASADETGTGSAVGESPVPQGCAQGEPA